MQVLSQGWRQWGSGIPDQGKLGLPTYPRRRESSHGLTRLLCAAVVSHSFASKLLSDPAKALGEGYLGEHFLLTPAELAAVMAIHAATISEFAAAVVASSLEASAETTASIHYGLSETAEPHRP